MRRGLALVAMVLLVAVGCSDDAEVPSPEVVELSDGSRVWKIDDADCPEGADCGYGVHINRWYYGAECVYPRISEEELGAIFAVGEGTIAEEARVIVGRDPSTLALHVQRADCDGWFESVGQFEDQGLDDPPSNPTQAPPDQ